MKRSRILNVLLILLLVVFVLYLFFGNHGLVRYYELKTELELLRQHNAELERQNEQLARQVKVLREDVRAIENAIRQELGYVKEGELVVFFDDDDDVREPGPHETTPPEGGR